MSIRIIPEATRITDNNGRIAEISENTRGQEILDVHDADFHNTVINAQFHYDTGSSDFFTTSTTAGDYSFQVSSSFFDILNVGDYLKIEENGNNEAHFPFITFKLSSPTVTVNKPLDNNYGTSTTVEVIDIDLASTAANFSSPRTYHITPSTSSVWHVMRYMISITDNTQPDDGKFGGISALSNGLTLRENTASRKYTLTHWRTNADMVRDMYDVDYRERAAAGTWGQRGRWSPGERIKAISLLNGTSSDALEAIIHDDLTDLTAMFMNAQCHKEGE